MDYAQQMTYLRAGVCMVHPAFIVVIYGRLMITNIMVW